MAPHSSLLVSLLAACAIGVAHAQAPAEEPRTTPAELEQAIYAFADRYASHVVAATDSIARNNPSPEQRRIAHLIKLVNASSVYDIATDAEPFAKLLDLLMMVTLQSYAWIDEDRAEKTFGERGEPLIRAFRQLRVDVWNLAGRVLRPEQLQQVDALILDWRRQNPNIQLLSYVRFDDISAAQDRAAIEEIKKASGLFSEIAEATKAVDQARLLAERAFYQAKRMPYLLNWQMQALLQDTLLQPEISRTLEVADSLARSADRASRAAERLPDHISAEREAVLAAYDLRSKELAGMLGDIRKTAATVDELAARAGLVAETGERLTLNLRDTTRAVDGIMARQAAQPSSKPFEIEPYVKAANELNQTVAGINSALARLDTLSGKRPLAPTIDDARSALAGEIDHLFWRALALMAAFFIMLLGYRWVAARMGWPR